MMKLLSDEADFSFTEEDYRRVRDDLVARGEIITGGGRGRFD